MNTWEIIKSYYIKDSTVGTVGFVKNVNYASKLFVKLLEKIVDKEESLQVFNADEEVKDALEKNSFIKMMKEEGLI
jgi:hypothetical protein